MSMNPDNRTPLLQVSNFRSAYSEKVSIWMDFPEDSEWTDQSFAAECDINTIMARYQSTGELPIINQSEAQWLDVTEMEFQDHMNFMVEARNMFDELPSKIRDRFGNDPGAFLGFASDEANRTELAHMGLLTPEATEAILYPKPPADAPLISE